MPDVVDVELQTVLLLDGLLHHGVEHPGAFNDLFPMLGSSLVLFCLKRLSRHYLLLVAASGEKDESEVRTSRTVQRG